MTRTLSFLILLLALSNGWSCTDDDPLQTQDEKTVLVFSKTAGFRHSSIPDGIALFEDFAANDPKLTVIATEDSTRFTSGRLEDIDAVIFLNTTGDVLNNTQQQALQSFVRQGGGFMGVHSATDTEYGWPWYGRLIGARFADHPAIQQARLEVHSQDHPSTTHLPMEWVRTDEWYNFNEIRPQINTLITIDESSYMGGTNGEDHPIAWYQEFEGGRVFYTAGGHTPESYRDSLFSEHLRGGLHYVLGD